MPTSVTVVMAKFEDLVAIGLRQLISEDPNLDLISDGVPLTELDAAVDNLDPSVVLLNFGSLGSPASLASPVRG